MITGARKLPTRHVSIRVPWHDSGWNGTVCARPDLNSACRALARIAEEKDDASELSVKGASFEHLDTKLLPPCVDERAQFMAAFPFTKHKVHPYVKGSSAAYSHFRPTPYTVQPYSAACTPFRWMLSKQCVELADELGLDYEERREPELGFPSAWIQERKNQLVMLDTFFGAIEPQRSLCFFYAKDTPLSSSGRRVIIGVGRVLAVGEPVEYKYDRPDHDRLRCVLWERNVTHSIRPGGTDGFLFPYAELLDVAMEQGIDPEQFVAFAPDEAFGSFSYASEHVPHDHAIASILSCVRALERIAEVHEGPWKAVQHWLDGELNRLWRLRGPFPGFGSALTAVFGPGGNLVAYEIAAKAAEGNGAGNVDPWPEFERVMRAPDLAGGAVSKVIGEGFERTWRAMPPERKALLQLLSRFSLTAEQAKRFFEPSQRPSPLEDAAIVANPYLIYETDRVSEDPVAVETIDRGMLPSPVVLDAHPLPDPTRLSDRVDPRRVRVLVVAALEAASAEGHTLLPRAWLTNRLDAMPLDTPCPVGVDVLAGVRDLLGPVVVEVEMADGTPAYQLDRLANTRALISSNIDARVGSRAKRHELSEDWRARVDAALGPIPTEPSDREAEEAARTEKAAALEELASSRMTVLIGAAGTGKTTLLKMLCQLGAVNDGGVLLLAPTGKARIQLEKKTGQEGRGQTIAQFLLRLGGRFDPHTGAYRVTNSPSRCSDYQTVIVDECSMLTEEQLAALIDGLTGVQRLVLVGDHRQLPPIGSGRPFVDIVRRLAPKDIETRVIRVDKGYAELTIPRRQQGAARADLALAGWFGGDKTPAADEIWERLASEKMSEIRFVPWTDPQQVQKLLVDLVVEELGLSGPDDELGFASSLGGSPYNGTAYFWRTQDASAPSKAEAWQIISPIRAGEAGVDSINHLVQRSFRTAWQREATTKGWSRRVNPPLGRHNIIYGDKVINLRNSASRTVWPERPSYVANGDVGLVVGALKTKKQKTLFKELAVEFTSQLGHEYKYKPGEFNGEGSDPLELAYALTVHKTQGSEFGTTFVVLPDPCWLLSRELLYTALTRQQDRVIVLHQGDLRSLRKYSREEYSDIARRMTNLFVAPDPVSLEFDGRSRFLDEHLIHRTKRGDLVRSKSEVIIANELSSQGFDRYEYERQLTFPSGAVRYPDFTIVDDNTGETFYWEHLGLLHNPEYRARWERKLAAYREAGILPHEEGGGANGSLIVTRDDEAGGIDAQAIAVLIATVLKP